jgi:hypothetical protein
MKKMILGIGLGVVLCSLVSTTAVSLYEVNKGTAEVEKQQGYYIYAKSKPIKEYEFLGTLTAPKIGNHEFDILVSYMVKDCQKNYPNADAILFDGNISQTHNTKASAIKFK